MTMRDTLIGWLNDAYAMEKGMIETLDNHAQDAEGHPQVRSRIQEHLEETRRHADLVQQCVERLGGSTSAVKTAMGKISGMFEGVSTAAAEDELVKNALGDYSAEHLEIASYRALITAAEALGEQEVAQTCEQILRDEEEMALWLEQNLPVVVKDFLQREAARA